MNCCVVYIVCPIVCGFFDRVIKYETFLKITSVYTTYSSLMGTVHSNICRQDLISEELKEFDEEICDFRD